MFNHHSFLLHLIFTTIIITTISVINTQFTPITLFICIHLHSCNHRYYQFTDCSTTIFLLIIELFATNLSMTTRTSLWLVNLYMANYVALYLYQQIGLWIVTIFIPVLVWYCSLHDAVHLMPWGQPHRAILMHNLGQVSIIHVMRRCVGNDPCGTGVVVQESDEVKWCVEVQ